MAINRERPHLLVLPEDDATRSMAVGFVDVVPGQMQVLGSAGGWGRALEDLKGIHAYKLRRYPLCRIVLLIDFDDQFPQRLEQIRNELPADIADRVFVLGALDEAEQLRNETGQKFGPLGQALARECGNSSRTVWRCAQLRHNEPEVDRLCAATRDFLFA